MNSSSQGHASSIFNTDNKDFKIIQIDMNVTTFTIKKRIDTTRYIKKS